MRTLQVWVVFILALVLAGCSVGDVVSNSGTRVHGEAIKLAPGMTQAEVVDQLGVPPFFYEMERVMSYLVYEQDGQLFREYRSELSTTKQLMLQFSTEWKLERISIVQSPL